MLTRRTARSRRQLALATLLTAVLATTGVMLVRGPDVYAAPPGHCDSTPDQTECEVGNGTTHPGDPGSGGNGNAGGGPRVCTWRGTTVACYIPGTGSFNNSDGCYYRVADPQPDNLEEGLTQYYRSCIDNPGVQEPIALPGAPDLVPPDPEELALEILTRIRMVAPAIHLAPQPRTEGGVPRALVGLPIWMWTDDTDENWGPATRTETLQGLTVSVTVKVTRIEWNMGDGSVVTCTKPGTEWTQNVSRTHSPDCGYPKAGEKTGYQKASRNQEGGRYQVSATTFWEVTWEAGDDSGELTAPPLTSEAALIVDELQVVNR